ncbi:MAG: thiolase family protein [Steroidobacteraceae bacterium]
MTLQGVCIVGAAAAPCGRYAEYRGQRGGLPEAELLTRITLEALADAGIPPEEVGSAVFTPALPESPQQGFASHMAARLGLRCTGQLSEVLQMGISGGLAFDQAAADIQLGRCDVALALGVAYPTGGHPGRAMSMGLRVTGDAEFMAPLGATPIAWYAMDAARYMHETGAVLDQLAAVAVKSRLYARANPLAQFQDRLTLEQVLAARRIVEPLGLHDVPAVADGAICLVLASAEAARTLGRPTVSVRARAFRHDGHHPFGDRPHDITGYPALREASEAALRNAAIGSSEIDVAELYSPCTITEILATEALGWFERGAGAAAAAEGRTGPGGDRPVNTSGGCLSRGHPPVLSALYGLLELREQLLGLAGARQVPGARLALASCEGGNYNSTIVHVLEGPT